MIYRTLFYVNIYGSYKLLKNSPVFWPTLYFIDLWATISKVLSCPKARRVEQIPTSTNRKMLSINNVP